jgi:hypothetical protein
LLLEVPLLAGGTVVAWDLEVYIILDRPGVSNLLLLLNDIHLGDGSLRLDLLLFRGFLIHDGVIVVI